MATGTDSKAGADRGGNEGEGSRSADQRYRAGVQHFLSEQDPEALGKEAARDVAADPEAYRAAEAAGRQRAVGEDPEAKEGRATGDKDTSRGVGTDAGRR